MNQPSVFQLQYPLSPRKFWKKMLGRVIPDLFYSVILGMIATFGVYAGYIALYNPYSESNPADFGIIAFSGIGLILGIFLIISLLYAWYVKVYIRRYYYDCGEQFITIKKGVFAPTEIHVQYQKIQDVYVDQDLLDRILGLYDVHIASATITSGIEAHIDGVNADVAESLKNIILAKIHGSSASPTNSYQIPTQQPPQPQVNPIQFSQKISSETYPINGKWIWSAMSGAIISGLFFTLIPGVFLAKVFNSNIIYWLVFLIAFILSIIWSSIWKNNFYFEFTPDYILLRTGVVSRQENHLPYKSIQNVLNQQGFVDRILGLSTVVIQNAAQQVLTSRGQAIQGSGISLVWQPPEKAEELSKLLNDIVSKINPQNSSAMGV